MANDGATNAVSVSDRLAVSLDAVVRLSDTVLISSARGWTCCSWSRNALSLSIGPDTVRLSASV